MQATSSTVEQLARLPLFADASPSALVPFVKIAVRKSLAPKVVVVRQGESDGSLYGVLDGLLQASICGSDGRQIVLSLLRDGHMFGEVTLFDLAPRSATVTTLKRTELVVFPAQAMLDTVRNHPEVCFKMLSSMASLVRRLTTRVEELTALPIPTRLARKLLEIADICGTPIGPNQVALPPAFSQTDLASHVQATRESVNKNLAGWLKEGVLQRTNSQLIIRDRPRLSTIARGSDQQTSL